MVTRFEKAHVFSAGKEWLEFCLEQDGTLSVRGTLYLDPWPWRQETQFKTLDEASIWFTSSGWTEAVISPNQLPTTYTPGYTQLSPKYSIAELSPTKPEPKKCTCTMTTLMRTGCKCNGV